MNSKQLFTAQQLLESSHNGKSAARSGRLYKGVLTSEEASERAKNGLGVITVSSHERKVFFFSDDHCFGYPLLPSDFVSSSCQMPMTVVPRPQLTSGIVNTVDEFITIFESDRTQLLSIEALVEFLNSEE